MLNVASWQRWIAGIILTAASLAAGAEGSGPRLLLAGGALPVCSSASPRFCNGGAPTGSTQQIRYRLDGDAMARMARISWHAHRLPVRRQLLSTFASWQAQVDVREWSGDALRQLLRSENRPAWQAWDQLAEFEQWRVLDVLEVAPATEVVDLARSGSDSGADIFRELVAMARTVSGRERPHVLISTASSRDPYAAIDFYLDVFAQAGAEVRWLPLDQAMRVAQANRGSDCEHLDALRGQSWGALDRTRLYPERAAELVAACRSPRARRKMLDWADALFLNGGDQSWTRAAWFEPDGSASADLLFVQKRLQAGNLVVGGTSAGTAVQASRDSPMLISGSALPQHATGLLRTLIPDPSCAQADACQGIDPDALWVHPDGGLGTFPLGILDTHFSERGRDYRLARVLIDTQRDLAIGVDETTALRVDLDHGRWRTRVIGHGGATWLMRVRPEAVIWQRQVSGQTLVWPRELTTPDCGSQSPRMVSIEAGNEQLAQTILAARNAEPIRIRLYDGRHAIEAGQICAGTTSQRLWQLAPIASGPNASNLPSSNLNPLPGDGPTG